MKHCKLCEFYDEITTAIESGRNKLKLQFEKDELYILRNELEYLGVHLERKEEDDGPYRH